jgi:DNA repair protein RecO
MHHIHRTKAFVLKSYPIKEADKNLILLTEDLGVIHATAMAARKGESKMRQSVQDFSSINAAVVSGRAGWRMTNVAFVNNFYQDIKNETLRESLCRIFTLIERLVAGEDSDPELFKIVEEFVDFARSKEELLIKNADIESFEIIFTARILNHLGYFVASGFSEYVNDQISLDTVISLSETASEDIKAELIKEINRAIRDSDL